MQLDRVTQNIIIGVLILAAILAGSIWYFYSQSVLTDENVAKVKITNCSSIEPTFLSAPKDKPVYFVNLDSKEHTVKIAGSELRLGAGEEINLSANLTYGAGTYAYDCDDSKDAGRIQIEGRNEAEASTAVSFKELYDDSMNEAQKKCAREAFVTDFDDVYKGLSAMREEAQNKFAACVTAQ
ncbi:MAG: hypothetical protein AAB659_00005 [Patescibacteria group bacterium]